MRESNSIPSADARIESIGTWSAETTASGVQAEDRPGKDVSDELGDLDADNVYGHDAAYDSYKTFYLGAACSVTVNAQTGDVAGTHAEPNGSCQFIDNGYSIFTSAYCMQTPQEDNEHNLCYHVGTDATRMFMS